VANPDDIEVALMKYYASTWHVSCVWDKPCYLIVGQTIWFCTLVSSPKAKGQLSSIGSESNMALTKDDETDLPRFYQYGQCKMQGAYRLGQYHW